MTTYGLAVMRNRASRTMEFFKGSVVCCLTARRCSLEPGNAMLLSWTTRVLSAGRTESTDGVCHWESDQKLTLHRARAFVPLQPTAERVGNWGLA